jgi:hypothetical protein
MIKALLLIVCLALSLPCQAKYKDAQYNPQLQYQINAANPITRGLIFLAPCQNGYPRDIVKGRQATQANITTVRTNQGLTCAGNAAWANQPDLNFLGGPFTTAVYINISTLASDASYPDIFSQDGYVSESSNNGWLLQVTSTPTYVFNTDNNTAAATYQLASSVTPTVGDHIVIGILTSANKYIYVDGVSSTNTNGLTIGTCSSTVTLGGSTIGVATYYVAIWNRAINPIEAAYLSKNPWSLFTVNQQGD